MLIIGAGITGAMLAEHLTAQGRKVTILDREKAGVGSTAASTAMLQWEIDLGLAELTALYGFEPAARLYRQSFQAVQALKAHAAELDLRCAFKPRHSLYIAAGTGNGESTLKEEHLLRARAGLPTRLLTHAALLQGYGIDREAALESAGSAEADPICLAHQLLTVALHRGAELYDGEAVGFESSAHGAAVQVLDGPIIEAKTVILATGYAMPDFVKSTLHIPSASWAIATRPQSADGLWPHGALIWENATPYSYLRTTADHRIIIGGEDERGLVDPEERESLTAVKASRLQRKLATLFPRADTAIDYAWSGAFSETQDGLPLIGPVPNKPSIYAAFGYGGNGITFSFLAARMIGRMMNGQHERWDELVAIDR